MDIMICMRKSEFIQTAKCYRCRLAASRLKLLLLEMWQQTEIRWRAGKNLCVLEISAAVNGKQSVCLPCQTIISQCNPCCFSYSVKKHRRTLLTLVDDLQILRWNMKSTQKPFLWMNEMWKEEQGTEAAGMHMQNCINLGPSPDAEALWTTTDWRNHVLNVSVQALVIVLS